MFVRCKRRFRDGKEHRYWSVVENVRVRGGRVAGGGGLGGCGGRT